MTSTTKPQVPTDYPGGLTRHQVVKWRNSIFIIFALCGLGISSWLSRVPTVRDLLHIQTDQLGYLAFGIAVGSIVGLLASSHIIARLGAARTIAWSLSIGGVGFITAGFGASALHSYAVVYIGLALFGLTTGLCDVAMNVNGAANERVLGRSIMPIFHAFFSFGTMIGAGLGAVAESIHLPVFEHALIIGVAITIAALFSVRALQSEHLVGHGQEIVADDDHSKTWRGRLSIWKNPFTILIGLIVLGAAFTEGSANDWLSLAMVDGHGTDHATGALVLGIFVTAMTVGRLVGVMLLDRFGRVPVLRGSALLAAVGLLIFIFVPDPIIAVAGAVLWGLGAALGFPVGMSAAADDPKTAAARVSAVATVGYFAFLVGPPVIGLLAKGFGILHALLVVLVLAAVSGLVSFAAREPEKQAARRP
ncbi:MAG: major facilitator superfamily 1 [Glaciihabitans sp.]|jgi:MFS family permease|nr:major facilitator superfamily 1 [Glaciihabitans sp.]